MHRDKHIARAILKGYSNSSIARRHGLSPQRVKQIRQAAGLPDARAMPATRDRYQVNPAIADRNKAIIRLYQGDTPIARIVRELGVPRTLVNTVISAAGVAQDRHMKKDPVVTARNRRVVARYQEGISLKDLATEFEITLSLTSNIISTAGVANRRRPVRGAKALERSQRTWDRRATSEQGATP